MTRKIEVFPLNRVEGDLEITIEMEDGLVVDARSAGTMYRGFENIMVGRAPLDGLVITPRICGICSTAHLYAAASALDMIYGVEAPRQATWIRNITAMTEMLQNDFRHAFLLYMPDFTDEAYQKQPLYNAMVERYTPLKGTTVRRAIDETCRILEIISILGGQWPHSSFMVPGGVVSMPSPNDLRRCLYLLNNFKHWYEKDVLGCSLERWQAVRSKADLVSWIKENEAHSTSDLGHFIRFATRIGLHQVGRGHGNFIGFGMPGFAANADQQGGIVTAPFACGGFYTENRLEPMDQKHITEDVSHAWFAGGGRGQHPYRGQSLPYASGDEGSKYSWAKAPRYKGKPAETGPLAEMIIARDPLFTDFMRTDGPSAFLRELARLVRAAGIIPAIEGCLEDLLSKPEKYYRDHGSIEQPQGHGLIEAPRGALGHWLNIRDNKIVSYQIITPTVWNASPRDIHDVRGPWEEALVGTRVNDSENPLEIHHVIRSFDPCLVCTVHAIDLR